MPYAQLSGVNLFYTDEGRQDGTPILFIHGWTCDSNDWIWQLPAFTSRYRVIAPDLRGHGRSEAPASGYSRRQFAADLVELLQALDASPAIVVGHSLGGVVGAVMSVEHPEHVLASVMVDPAYGYNEQEARGGAAFAAKLAEPGGIETVAGFFASLEAPSTDPALVTWHRRRALGTPLHVVVEVPSDPLNERDEIVNRPMCDAYMKRRSQPVLSVQAKEPRAAWEEDTLTDPRSRVVAWAGAGHWLHQERPDEFNSLVLSWLAEAQITP